MISYHPRQRFVTLEPILEIESIILERGPHLFNETEVTVATEELPNDDFPRCYGTPLLSYYAANALYGVVISIYLVVKSIYCVVISICDMVISIYDVVM